MIMRNLLRKLRGRSRLRLIRQPVWVASISLVMAATAHGTDLNGRRVEGTGFDLISKPSEWVATTNDSGASGEIPGQSAAALQPPPPIGRQGTSGDRKAEEPLMGEAKRAPDELITRYLRPWQAMDASRLFGKRSEMPSYLGWLFLAGLPLLTFPVWFWAASRPRTINPVENPGFEVISASEKRRFITLKDKFQYLDFVSGIKTDKPLRLSANLNKVSLSIRRFGYMLEDKNFRNALLVNRRRMRRTLLKNGDVLDLGDLTLLYRDPRGSPVTRYSSTTPLDGKTLIKYKRVRGPIRKGMPALASEQYPNRVFYMTKNLIFIGRSEDNDLVVKSRNVHYRHAKIERVGGRFKLLDLGMTGNTFVNNRRVEQQFLRDGDLITIDKQRFKFTTAPKDIREQSRYANDSFSQSGDQGADQIQDEEAPAI